MSYRSLVVRFVGALVGVVAIAFAAASIDDAVEPGGEGGQGGQGEPGAPISIDSQPPPRSGAEVPAFLEYLFLALVAVAAIVVVWYVINNHRQAVKLLALGILLTLALLLLYEVLSGAAVEISPPEPEMPMNASNETGGGEPGSTEGEGEADPWPVSSLAMLLAVVAAIFVGALVLTRTGGGTDSSALEGATREPDDETAAVGAAAGRAADRIEASDEEAVDNEVYRAWRDMTDLLEVDHPETSTPGEFADAAVESGLDREHVEELTRLFEDVRYGHAATTEERERRAVAVLRRIEAEYADGEAAPGTDGDRP